MNELKQAALDVAFAHQIRALLLDIFKTRRQADLSGDGWCVVGWTDTHYTVFCNHERVYNTPIEIDAYRYLLERIFEQMTDERTVIDDN